MTDARDPPPPIPIPQSITTQSRPSHQRVLDLARAELDGLPAAGALRRLGRRLLLLPAGGRGAMGRRARLLAAARGELAQHCLCRIGLWSWDGLVVVAVWVFCSMDGEAGGRTDLLGPCVACVVSCVRGVANGRSSSPFFLRAKASDSTHTHPHTHIPSNQLQPHRAPTSGREGRHPFLKNVPTDAAAGCGGGCRFRPADAQPTHPPPPPAHPYLYAHIILSPHIRTHRPADSSSKCRAFSRCGRPPSGARWGSRCPSSCPSCCSPPSR